MNLMKDSLISGVSFNYVSLEEKVRVIVVSVPVLTEFLADSDAFGKCLAILSLSFHCDVILKGYCDFLIREGDFPLPNSTPPVIWGG